MKKLVVMLMALISIPVSASAQQWREHQALMLNVSSTISCDLAPVAREWHRMLEEGRVGDAFIFGITYCRKIVWAPVPLIVVYEDDMSSEPGPAVCVRQVNWRSCEWVAREYLESYDPRVLLDPSKAQRP